MHACDACTYALHCSRHLSTHSTPPPTNMTVAAGGGGGGGGGGQGGDGNKGGDNPLVAFWKGYNKMLKDQPLFTKALTSFVGFSAGDFLAQKFIDKAEQVDMKRLLKLALFGFLIHGPTGHFFYGALDGKIPGTDALSVASKVCNGGKARGSGLID
jgi:protein Mpv17